MIPKGISLPFAFMLNFTRMKKLLVIVGPTGTGKTALGIELAKKFNGEVVSADSRQVYVGMDVGTGKSPQRQKAKGKRQNIQREKGRWVVDGIPIHLYDLITPDKTFSVAEYQQVAYKIIDEIYQRDKLPIIVGGTGLYVQAVVEGLKIPKVAPDKNLRAHLEAQPLDTLVKELEKVDPATASRIDRQNPRRIIRALEVYHQTGEPFSKLKGKFKVDFDSLQIGLNASREYLYERLDDRVEDWFKTGFVEEVKRLLEKGYRENLPAMTSLGYRQAAMYLAGKISLEEAKQRIKWEHHAFVRRQMTWFRRGSKIIWLSIEEAGFEKEAYQTVARWLSSEI